MFNFISVLKTEIKIKSLKHDIMIEALISAEII